MANEQQGIFWFTHFSSFPTQDRRMIIILAERKCSLTQRRYFCESIVRNLKHKKVMLLSVYTLEDWRLQSKDPGRCCLSSIPEDPEFWSNYSWYHWSMILIISDHYHHIITHLCHGSLTLSPGVSLSLSVIITLSNHILASVSQALKKGSGIKSFFRSLCSFHAQKSNQLN